MKKFYLFTVISLLLIFSGCQNTEPAAKNTNNENMTLNIEVIDEVHDKVLFNQKVTIEKKVDTLSEFLQNADELKVKMEKGQYGNIIVSMLGIETSDFNSGPWWIYESKNNDDCIEQSQCPASDSLQIKNGDSFKFIFEDFN